MSKTPYRRRKKKSNAGRIVLTGLALLVCACAVAFGLVRLVDYIDGRPGAASSGTGPQSVPLSSAVQSVAPSLPPSEPPQPIEHRISFSAVGDNLIHDSIIYSANLHAGGEGYDFSFCYENVRDFFSQFDINCINQETLITADHTPSGYPMFASPPQVAQAAYNAGWRVFSLANNHTYDKLASGISSTLRFWEEMPDDTVYYGLFTGKNDDSGIALQQVDGVTIAYVAFTYGTNGIPQPEGVEAFVIITEDYPAMEYKVRRAREMADIVVVSTHWGVEYSHQVHPTQTDLAQNLANWGADVVIGTHPHVIQDIAWYTSDDGRPVLVAYSLGNFVSSQDEPARMVGLALAFDLVMVEAVDGTMGPLAIENAKAYPVVTQYEYPGGPYYRDSRVYMYRDYTDELAALHPMRGKNAAFGCEYIKNLCETYVNSEFLVLD